MNLKNLIPHIFAVIAFIVVPTIYVSPVLDGKVLRSGDLIHGIGNNQELKEYREENGEEALWNSRLFSGMPSFQMSIQHYGNIGEKINAFIGNFGSGPVSIFFIMSVSFYILLLTLGVNAWLAIFLSFGFTFSSFNIISIEAGHNWKIRTLAYAPGIIAGVLAVYKNQILKGAALTAFFLCMHLTSNHFQITYYLLLMLLFYGGFKAVESYKNKTINLFIKQSLILVGAALIGFGPTIAKLWTTYEYSKETIRGGNSELTLNKPEGETKSTGLDKDYAMRWSYSPMETFTLIIPYFKGGASTETLSEQSNLAKAGFPKQYLSQIPTYWGEQPFTSGPVYLGAVIIFLFVFGLFFLHGNIRYWLLSYSIFCIILSWGRHFSFVSEFMFNYFPMFNKFRTPSMVLIMLSITFPLLGALAIQKLTDGKNTKQEIFKALKNSLIVTLGITFVFGILGSYTYDFSSATDAQLKQSGWPIEALIKDRASMMRTDAFRSMIFILGAAAAIWLFAIEKIKKEYVIGIVGSLLLIDLWMVDKRYLNNEKFVKNKEFENIHAPNLADKQILADPDRHFRVFNVTVNPFTDARTSYFHKSLGGYHAAKLLRYQELIENQLGKNNREVINMLNTKYFITSNQNKQVIAQQNPEANGVGWFVQNVKWVNSANEEMQSLSNFNSKTEAIINQEFQETVGNKTNYSVSGKITLTQYDPKHMVYEVVNNSNAQQLAVFSEVFYKGNEDWKAYVDGNFVPHIRANYVLRAMQIEPGTHKVEFKFEPASFYTGNSISFAFSIMLVLLVVGSLGVGIKKELDKGKD